MFAEFSAFSVFLLSKQRAVAQERLLLNKGKSFILRFRLLSSILSYLSRKLSWFVI